MTRSICLNLFIFASILTSASAQTLINVEPDSWVYPILDRFVARGYITVDTDVRPLTRGEIATALKNFLIEAMKQPSRVSPVDMHLLTRLAIEFREELVMEGIGDVESLPPVQDRPFLSKRKEDDYLALDAGVRALGTAERTRLKDSLCTLDTLLCASRTSVELEVWGQFGRGPVFDEMLVFTKIEGDEGMSDRDRQRGLTGWKSGTAEAERAYLKNAFGPVQVEVGRDRLWWGPGRFGTLLVSSGGEPLDMVAVSVKGWSVSARSFTAVISATEGIYVSAHMFSFHFPLKTTVGFSEAVVYKRESFPELQYVNPLVPYYLAEHNLHEDDNTLWNFSFVTCPGAGIRFHGEFLIDDFQYERSAGAPDKLGGIAGFQVSNPLGMPDSDIRCEYTRLNKWVYTHRDLWNNYVHRGIPIGDALGPDSDRLVLELCHRPTGALEFLVGYRYLRHGEGSLEIPWEEEGGDPRPQFPSGKVEMFNSLLAELSYRPFRWVSFESGLTYTRSRNSSAFGICPRRAVDFWQWQVDLGLDI